MELLVEREEVWAAGLEDKPGALAGKLAILSEAGADLEFIIARRSHEKPGMGVVFVTPLRGDREVRAAGQVGFTVSNSLHSVLVEGKDQPGLAAKLTQKLAEAGVNLRGFSAAVIGTKFVMHVAFDAEKDVKKAMKLLAKVE
jgi:predicted amino acid-binding ACT domain protein